jgi:hypothetical protein
LKGKGPVERREKQLLEALYGRYEGPESFPTFQVNWVEQGGRKYFQIGGTYLAFDGGTLEYDRKHSLVSILQLVRDGYVQLEITITNRGKDLVDPPKRSVPGAPEK